MPDANLTRSVMQFFDCFMDDFYDENYIHTLSDLDIRGQVEVTFSYSDWRTFQRGIFVARIGKIFFHLSFIHRVASYFPASGRWAER